eukprot:m.326430 g.326430  ORF g.326430 m.326430 type:complete len:1240 (-) comp16558_c1_seq9:200-3919(-)
MVLTMIANPFPMMNFIHPNGIQGLGQVSNGLFSFVCYFLVANVLTKSLCDFQTKLFSKGLSNIHELLNLSYFGGLLTGCWMQFSDFRCEYFDKGHTYAHDIPVLSLACCLLWTDFGDVSRLSYVLEIACCLILSGTVCHAPTFVVKILLADFGVGHFDIIQYSYACDISGHNVALLIVCVGVVFLLGDVHFPLIICVPLSLTYWRASVWLMGTDFWALGFSSCVFALWNRSSWLLFGLNDKSNLDDIMEWFDRQITKGALKEKLPSLKSLLDEQDIVNGKQLFNCLAQESAFVNFLIEKVKIPELKANQLIGALKEARDSNAGENPGRNSGKSSVKGPGGSKPRKLAKNYNYYSEDADEDGYTWSVSRKQRNRAVHSRNGNMDYGYVVNAIMREAFDFQKDDLTRSAATFYKTLKEAFTDADAILAEMAIEFVQKCEKPSQFMTLYETKYEALMSANEQGNKRKAEDDENGGPAQRQRIITVVNVLEKFESWDACVDRAREFIHSLRKAESDQVDKGDLRVTLSPKSGKVDLLLSNLHDPGLFLMKEQVAELEKDISLNHVVSFPGAGKTRALYEYLSTHYGIYLTAATVGNGGSDALSSVLDFKSGDAVQNFASCCFAAHIFTLAKLRQILVDMTPREWLLMQLYPKEIFGYAFFAVLADRLFNTDNLQMQRLVSHSLGYYQTRHEKSAFPVCLDEAQVLVKKTVDVTKVDGQGNQITEEKYLYRQVLLGLQTSTGPSLVKLIVSGTYLDSGAMKNIETSSTLKFFTPSKFQEVTNFKLLEISDVAELLQKWNVPLPQSTDFKMIGVTFRVGHEVLRGRPRLTAAFLNLAIQLSGVNGRLVCNFNSQQVKQEHSDGAFQMVLKVLTSLPQDDQMKGGLESGFHEIIKNFKYETQTVQGRSLPFLFTSVVIGSWLNEPGATGGLNYDNEEVKKFVMLGLGVKKEDRLVHLDISALVTGLLAVGYNHVKANLAHREPNMQEVTRGIFQALYETFERLMDANPNAASLGFLFEKLVAIRLMELLCDSPNKTPFHSPNTTFGFEKYGTNKLELAPVNGLKLFRTDCHIGDYLNDFDACFGLPATVAGPDIVTKLLKTNDDNSKSTVVFLCQTKAKNKGGSLWNAMSTVDPFYLYATERPANKTKYLAPNRQATRSGKLVTEFGSASVQLSDLPIARMVASFPHIHSRIKNMLFKNVDFKVVLGRDSFTYIGGNEKDFWKKDFVPLETLKAIKAAQHEDEKSS